MAPSIRRTLFLRLAASPPSHVAQRVVLAVGGGYLLAAGAAALSARLLAEAMAPSEATVLMGMLAFVVYLVLLIWAFYEPRLPRLWIVLGLGGPLAFGLAHLIATPAGGA